VTSDVSTNESSLDFLYVFNQNMRLSVPDKYPRVFRQATQGVQKSVLSPGGDLYGLNFPNEVSTLKLKYETLDNQCRFSIRIRFCPV